MGNFRLAEQGTGATCKKGEVNAQTRGAADIETPRSRHSISNQARPAG